MKRSGRALAVGAFSAVVLFGFAATPAFAGEAWLYRDCPNGGDVAASSFRTGGTETYHAYYQNGNGPYTLVRRTGALAASSTYLNYSDVHFLTDGSFVTVGTGCV